MNVKGYTLLKTEDLTDIHSTGYYFRHDKTGARVSCVKNDDENKVFFIGFRTPSRNSTGNAHILEHSVLCGSRKYPVKDPFVELAKGSLNTFLNAITYPDKTVYPVASCNDKDFDNLVDVYLDAVFYPAIYDHEEIFRQEGWHYELDAPEDDITINGVVYNEMKGAFSSPEDVLSRANLNSLYPDTGYGFESGGDPAVIPELTYEQFLDFHKTLYHPSNSYIYFYGDMDIEAKLRKLDEEYLCAFDKFDVDSEVKRQPAFSEMKKIDQDYAIAAEESEEDGTYLSVSWSYGECTDAITVAAMELIDEVLLQAPSAPIRQELLKSGICSDVMGGYDAQTLQPMFTVTAKGANRDDADRFLDIVKNAVESELAKGLDETMLRGIITQNIFKAREADTGRFPKGLLYGLGTLDTWLYDDDMPFDTLWTIRVNEQLLAKLGTGYFEALAKKVILENPHSVFVTLSPKKGKAAEDEDKVRQQLREYKNSLSDDEISKMISDTSALKKYQAERDTKEDLKKLPLLTREDLRVKAHPLVNEEIEFDGGRAVYHDVDTNGIVYASFFFDVTDLSEEEFKTLGLLSAVLGLMDTKERSFGDIYNEVNLRAGGMSFSVKSFDRHKTGGYRICVCAKYKALYDKAESCRELLLEVLRYTDFSDSDRLHQLIMEARSSIEMSQSEQGHTFAVRRAMAGITARAKIQELFEGYEQYKFICELDDDFDNRAEGAKEALVRLVQKIFVRSRLLSDITCEREALENQLKVAEKFAGELEAGAAGSFAPTFNPDLGTKKEGLYDASGVVYVCRAGSFADKGLCYTGALKVLRIILNYDYLWLNLRVQGGAYGCMSGFNRSGEAYLVSYRDPHLKETNNIYENCPDYIRDFEVDDRDMTKYVIGAFGDMDMPLSAEAKGSRSFMALMSELDYEDIQKDRDEARLANAASIRALAPYVEAILASGALEVVGNEEKIRPSKLLDIKEPLKV